MAIVLTLGVIVLLTFANTMRNTEFALDNKFIILEDPRLHVAKRDNVRLIFTQDYWWPKAISGLYRPLTTLSYLLNYSILGNRDNSTGYHWINFLLHWANAVLVYFTALVLLENCWPAVFIAGIFATHPIVTESVSNIVGRADLFATLATLGAFLCYVKSTTRRGVCKLPWLVALMLITTVGEFCKESAVLAIVGVIFLYDLTYRWPAARAKKLDSFVWEYLSGYLAWLPPLIVFLFVRSIVFAKLRPPELPFVDNPLIGLGFWEARLTAIKVIGKYLWLLVFPQTLSCDYSYDQIPLVRLPFRSIDDWLAVVSLAVVIAIVWVAIRSYRRNRAVFFFVLLFFGTFLPTSNLFPNPTFGQSLFDKERWCIGSVMAERFMYMPSIGYAGCLVIAVYAVCRRFIPPVRISVRTERTWQQVVPPTVLSVAVLAYGARAFVRNYDWYDDVRLWTQAAQACPNSFKSHKSLAYALYEKDPEGKNIDRIIEEGEKALAVIEKYPLRDLQKPSIVPLHLGAYYRIKGDVLAQRAPDGSILVTEAALPWYQKSVDVLMRAIPMDRAFNEDNRRKELARGRKAEDIVDVGNAEIYSNIGLTQLRLNNYQAALNAYADMRRLAATNPDAYIGIASVYIAAGEAEPAAVALVQTLLLDSNRTTALRYLMDLYRQLDREGCAVAFEPGQSLPKLNRDCAIVQSHLCNACYNLIQVFLETRQWTAARQIKQSALKVYNCPQQPFDQLLPDNFTPYKAQQ